MTDANPAASGTASAANEKEHAATQTQRLQDVLQEKAARDAELKAALAREGISDPAPPPPRATAADLEDGLWPSNGPWPSEEEERAKLAAQLAEHIAAIQTLDDNTVRDAFEIGLHLIEIKKIKKLLPHGKFLPMIEREYHFSPRTAQRMMNAAERFAGKYDTVSHLPIYLSAIYLLAGSDVPEGARDEAIRSAQSGGAVTKAVAKALIRKHKAREDGDPDSDADPFGGLDLDDLQRLTGSFCFFDEEQARADLRRATDGPYPPENIVSRLKLLIRRMQKVLARETGRRRDHGIYLGTEIRDRHYAKGVRNELVALFIKEYSDDDANFALLCERVASAQRVRELRRPKADA